MKPILDPNRSYNFSDYFYLSGTTEQTVAEFGYQFIVKKLDLPQDSLENVSLEKLKSDYYKKLPFFNLTSETAKREFFIAPLFFLLLDYVETKIDVEYILNVNEKLKGSIDYLLRSTQNLVVIEAKNADMEKGFTQLAVEMIAVDKFLEEQNKENKFVYGAVTVGDFWRFGILDRDHKLLSKDIDAFLVPSDLESLFSVFLGILRAKVKL